MACSIHPRKRVKFHKQNVRNKCRNNDNNKQRFKRKSKFFTIDIHNPHSKRAMNTATERKGFFYEKKLCFYHLQRNTVQQFYSSSRLTHFIVRHPKQANVIFFSALKIFKQVSDLYLWHFRIVILHCNFIRMATYFCIGNVSLSVFIPVWVRMNMFFSFLFICHTTKVMKDDE